MCLPERNWSWWHYNRVLRTSVNLWMYFFGFLNTLSDDFMTTYSNSGQILTASPERISWRYGWTRFGFQKTNKKNYSFSLPVLVGRYSAIRIGSPVLLYSINVSRLSGLLDMWTSTQATSHISSSHSSVKHFWNRGAQDCLYDWLNTYQQITCSMEFSMIGFVKEPTVVRLSHSCVVLEAVFLWMFCRVLSYALNYVLQTMLLFVFILFLNCTVWIKIKF